MIVPERDGRFTVQIEKSATVEVVRGETILDALLAQGIDFPFFCRAGTCRTCTCDLLAGNVELLPYAGFALTDEERAEGRILACRAVPQSDCTIALPDHRDRVQHPVRSIAVTITQLDELASGIVRVRCALGPRAYFYFSPGQYVRLAFGGSVGADFSIASIPSDPELEFHIDVRAGDATSRGIATEARVGDSLTLNGPYGNAYLRAGHAGPVLLIARDLGISPIQSILRAALEANPRRSISLVADTRATDDHDAPLTLEALEAKHPNLRVSFATGDPMAEEIARRARSLEGAKAYVAGSPSDVAEILGVLRAAGLPRRDIHGQTIAHDRNR